MREEKKRRSEIMRAVKSKNTAPELKVRKILSSMGYRYRINNPPIPGNPDIYILGLKKAIFVNGCFWHGHDCRRGHRVPKTNVDYWVKKIRGNVERDKLVAEELNKLGWQVLIIWECNLANEKTTREMIKIFMNDK